MFLKEVFTHIGIINTMIKKLTKENFYEEVLDNELPTLVWFTAEWCGPCKRIAPAVRELAEEGTLYDVGYVDVDSQQELSNLYEVKSVPTFIIFNNGAIDHRVSGMTTKKSLLEILTKIVERQ